MYDYDQQFVVTYQIQHPYEWGKLGDNGIVIEDLPTSIVELMSDNWVDMQLNRVVVNWQRSNTRMTDKHRRIKT
jgi:hypothetical protein